MKRIMTVMLAVIYITTGTISVMAGEPENNDAQKKESVSDSVKVQTSENTDNVKLIMFIYGMEQKIHIYIQQM